MGNYISNIANASDDLNEIITNVSDTISSLSKQVSELMEFKNEFERKKLVKYIIIYKTYNRSNLFIEYDISKNKIETQNYSEYKKIKYYPDNIDTEITNRLNINTINAESIINLFKQICPQHVDYTVDECYDKLLLLFNNYKLNN